MESIGQLAGGVAHDFNNLLTVINGYSDLLLDRIEQQDPRRSNLQQIRKAGEQASGLTQQLLAFSRRQVSQPQPLSLDDVITGSDKIFARLVGESIEVIAAPGAPNVRVMADPNQVH